MKNRQTKNHKLKSKKDLKSAGKNLLFCLAFAIATGILIYGVEYALAWLFYVILGSEKLATPLWNTIFQATSYVAILFILIFIPKFIKKLSSLKTDREELGLKNLPTWIDIGLAPVGFIVYFILASAIVQLFSLFPWFNATEVQDVGFNNLVYPLDRLIAFFALVVVAPIAEELIFRGWLYGKLRNRLSFIPAMLIVSVLFGILHGQWNVGVNVFALSLVLCSLREITGTAYSGIILHMLKNAIAFYLLYIVSL